MTCRQKSGTGHRHPRTSRAITKCRPPSKTTVRAFGGLIVLINNAGVVEPSFRLADADPEGWGQVIDINLKDARRCR
jgi:NAD(P)-dependent dehydrogenase (short-subunit alcohol dehydrogenase family)